MLNSKIKMFVLLKPIKMTMPRFEQNDYNVNIKNKNDHHKILFIFCKKSMEQEMQVVQYQKLMFTYVWCMISNLLPLLFKYQFNSIYNFLLKAYVVNYEVPF